MTADRSAGITTPTGFDYAANISIMFTEVDLLDRPDAARRAGFKTIECWWPFTDADPSEKDVDRFVAAVAAAGVRLIGLNFYAGDMPAGERGVASRPDRAAELTASTDHLIAIAEATECRRFNLLYGQYVDRWTVEAQRTAAVTAIRRAAERIKIINGVVMLEPLATPLNGRYPLTSCDDVIELLDGPLADLENVGLLFDLFHLGANGADLVSEAKRVANRVAHVQLADHPGRAEPGTGTLPIEATLAALAENGYRGHVGCEYAPSDATVDSLTWLPAGALDPLAEPDIKISTSEGRNA